ncbi:MAG: EamA/RhaT family transporter [Rubellimicrobium sp.]|nr:EamA/RhaT family transporter [Rubellimicrobium sp.]
MLWIAATITAAAAQTGRNLAQAGLTRSLGTLGATQVRFLYGLPFALLFLALAALATGQAPPMPTPRALLPLTLGALAQIGATALMLATMARRGFAVSTAWLKTEPVLIALGGLVLGEHIGAAQGAGIAIATAGVILSGRAGAQRGAGPVLTGLAAAAGFGISAIAFRAGILALDAPGALTGALTGLAISLAVQVVVLALWLALLRPGAMAATLAEWRGSVAAGFLGAFGSAMWFFAFALTSAAAARTLGLVEVIFAAVLARALYGERPPGRALWGMGVIVAGVGLLLAG